MERDVKYENYFPVESLNDHIAIEEIESFERTSLNVI